MIKKNRKVQDSKVKCSVSLSKIQLKNLELLLNAEYKGTKLYNPTNGCLYQKKMIPATLNDIHKATGKRFDKAISTLVSKGVINRVRDVRGRDVWMINPDVYWDYLGWELYYNRWLFSSGDHRVASRVVDASLYYGYYYHAETNEPVKKINSDNWLKMVDWWMLNYGDHDLILINSFSSEP